MAVQIQLRRDVANLWSVNNPVLAVGEVGLETDTLKAKFGNGASTWLSLDYAFPGAGVSVTSAELSAAIAVVSNAISNEISVRAAEILVVSNAASNALSVANAASAGVNVVSQALSNEISNRVSADNALSTAINVVSNALSTEAAALSARVNSVNTGLSAISARSVGDVSTHGLQSVINALSNRISAGGGTGSVTSQELSVVAAGLSVRIDTASALASVADLHASTASLAATSADAHANVASAAATSVDGRVNSVNTALSGISARSVGDVSTHGLQSVVNALSNRISAAGAGSVTSNELSAAAAALSVRIDTASALASVAELHASTASLAATSVDGRVNSVVYLTVQNLDATAMSMGCPVYFFTSAYGVKKSKASPFSAFNYVAGVVAETAIAVSATGLIQRIGLITLTSAAVRGVLSATGSSFSVGVRYVVDTSVGFVKPANTNVGDDVASTLVGVAVDSRTLDIQRGDPETLAGKLVSVAVALSARIDTVSTAASAAETHASVASVAATSADGHAATASLAATSADAHAATASLAATSADAHANTVSAAAAAVDARVNSVNTALSALSVRSVGDVSTHGIQSCLNALSNRISAGGGTASVTSQEMSVEDAALSNRIGSVNTLISNISVKSTGGTSVKGLQSVVDALSSRISAVVASTNSVTSQELSVAIADLSNKISIASAAATSADAHANTVSARVVSVSAELASLIQIASAAATSVNSRVTSVNTFLDGISAKSAGNISVKGLQSVVNALSDRLSIAGAPGSVNRPSYVSAGQVICATALTDVSGLCVSVSAGGIYQLQGQVMFSCSAVTGNGFALVFPTMSAAAGQLRTPFLNPVPGLSLGYSAIAWGNFGTAGSGSTLISANFAAGAIFNLIVEGTMNVNTTGVVKVQGRCSVSSASLTIIPGSWLKVFKIR